MLTLSLYSEVPQENPVRSATVTIENNKVNRKKKDRKKKGRKEKQREVWREERMEGEEVMEGGKEKER